MSYQPKKKSSTLNLAPMIDIVFLLLIFFLVSSTLQGEEALYNITVPDSSIGKTKNVEMVNIFLDQNNKIYYNQKEYSRQDIDNLITDLNAEKNNKIKIYADKESNFEAVVFLIEKFKNKNFQNISFALREEN
ncbi:ExbD/TolR family protein [Halanaerobium congolense]|jgi:biopolymer transport protein ExbD|uniref:Outer membrane transport energization protein ExbD n=1 Tax=Halanaerobium congolense TaxID=54121 RepID=A0A1G6I4Y3_9FIRM|nr:biopolymer transporter ExbD [Halanaerobium congolense]KXS48912.1 MAG: biopolymer transport protein ExbD [Halanaerobium sp. T82-1]OEG62409.1 MAG: biopolymer transporter ExbD [Halanaerobium sp. MDAL1]PUU91091.1 MAG: biopolymer transport protein ExbD [Halanaerobium sp.]PTX17084.1 outer membrane transport energization protein ExbD [Halanaerobium congolense]PXV69298.1 outer membrane transport energization protein ExbD [Halanaerobium congolense]